MKLDWIDFFSQVFRSLNGIRVLLNPFWHPISKTERRILEEVRPFIDEKYFPVFEEHLSKINFSQRQSGNKITVFFNWKFPGWYDWGRTSYFFKKNKKKKILRYYAEFSNGKTLKGNLISLDGNFCNMTFNFNVSQFDRYELLEIKVDGPIVRSQN